MAGTGRGLRVRPERIVICFDFEGALGMPHEVDYDLADATARILEVLAAREAHAVFFVVGRLVEEEPDVVRAIARAGHEIGLHGYAHEHLDALNAAELTAFETNLVRAGDALERLTGRRPTCFRAPYLLEPDYYRREVYDLLRRNGYTWVSNLEMHHPVEVLRPDARHPLRRRWRRRDGRMLVDRSRLVAVLVNLSLLRQERFGRPRSWRLRWLATSRGPFERDGLVEVPVVGPLDCDLVGLPDPDRLTPPDRLQYARAAVRALVHTPAPVAMMTFHDWVVTGGNRLPLLADVVDAAVQANLPIATHPVAAPPVATPNPTRSLA